MRASGILLPVASLPSRYGIGCFSKEAYEFVDILKEAGQKLWQILPLGQTGYGDSPYQSFSTFAGNPYFIDLETLIEDELLVLVGDCLVVLHGFGVDAIFVLSGERLLTFELLERACRSVAYGAFRCLALTVSPWASLPCCLAGLWPTPCPCSTPSTNSVNGPPSS